MVYTILNYVWERIVHLLDMLSEGRNQRKANLYPFPKILQKSVQQTLLCCLKGFLGTFFFLKRGNNFQLLFQEIKCWMFHFWVTRKEYFILWGCKKGGENLHWLGELDSFHIVFGIIIGMAWVSSLCFMEGNEKISLEESPQNKYFRYTM